MCFDELLSRQVIKQNRGLEYKPLNPRTSSDYNTLVFIRFLKTARKYQCAKVK